MREVLVRKATDLPLNIGDLPAEILVQLAGTDKFPDSQNPEELSRVDSKTLASSLNRLLDASGWNLPRSMEICERHALEAAMARTQGNQSQTAKLLGITSRSVYNKLCKYNLKIT